MWNLCIQLKYEQIYDIIHILQQFMQIKLKKHTRYIIYSEICINQCYKEN